jgi:hypothetical protein
MATFGIPLGRLVSFGASNAGTSSRLIFSGSGTPVSADPDNLAPQLLVAGQDAMEILTGQQFAVDKTGFSGMPYKESVVQWTYYLAATAGLSDAATWADLETRLSTVYKWFWGTYTYTNAGSTVTYSGASGQKGDLVVNDSGGTPRVARATWLSFPAKPAPGEIGMYQMELTFRLLEHFS